MKEESAAAEGREETCGTYLSIVIAAVSHDDFEVGRAGSTFDEEAVGVSAFGLVVDAEGAIHREGVEGGVVANEEPVAHPGGSEVAHLAVVGERACGSKLGRDAVG
jgi:hypothetical protein